MEYTPVGVSSYERLGNRPLFQHTPIQAEYSLRDKEDFRTNLSLMYRGGLIPHFAQEIFAGMRKVIYKNSDLSTGNYQDVRKVGSFDAQTPIPLHTSSRLGVAALRASWRGE